MTSIKNIGKVRQMVRFPGPFSKKAKQKKRARKEQESTPRSGYSSAEEGTDFYSDLEEEARTPTRPSASDGLGANSIDSRNSDGSDKASLANADAMSEASQEPFRYPSNADNLNWDDSTTFRHVNGVTVYEQQEPDSKEATYMVSASVHATPEDCLKAVLDITGGVVSDPMLFQSVMIEQITDQSRILKAKFQPRSWVSALAAPRETVVEQLWRQDENGVYLVMIHSKDHPAVPIVDTPWYHWFSPVRAQPEYLEGRPSHQCLVTLVLKLDLGGWLSSSSGTFMGSLLQPFMSTLLGSSVRNAFLQPLMMSVISLRDKVEQARFLVPPFTLGEPLFCPEERQPQQQRAEPPQQGGTRSMLAHLRSSRKQSGRQERSYTLDTKFWRDPGVANFKVRGANYLKDSKKIKSEEPYFELLTTELVATEDRVFNVSRFLPAIRDCKARFVFVLNVIFSKAPRLGLVMAWATNLDPFHPDKPWEQLTPHERCLQEFLEGDMTDPAANRKRHNMLKLIPSVPQGSWIIKQAVGSTPVLLGNKISTTYHRGPRWIEADIDMDSSGVANHVVALVKGVTTSQTIDMAVVLQGCRPELLPERLLGSVRFSRLDLKTAIPLNPDHYSDDLLEEPSPPPSPSPHASTTATPVGAMETSQSLQSLRSVSGSGSNISIPDMGHLEGLRQASGSSAQGQSDVAHVPARLTSQHSTGSALPVFDKSSLGPSHLGSGHLGSGHMGLGSGQISRAGSAASSSEHAWQGQQGQAGPQHAALGLTTVPETQQSPLPAQQQAFVRSRSLQQQGASGAKSRGSSNLGSKARGVPAERVRWSDKPVMSGHF